MKNNPKQKALYIAMCILAAIVVWVFVDNYGPDGAGPVVYTKWFRDVPITYNYETVLTERGLMLLDEGTDTTVDLKLEGTHWDLAMLDSEDIRVYADLSDVSRTGTQTLTSRMGFTMSYFTGKITLDRLDPSSLTINVAELYHKTVDVRCEITGNVAEGYSAGELQISPETLEVRGDKADVDAVSYVKVTLDLGENATSTVERELPIQFYDADGRLMEDSSLRTTEENIDVTLPVYVTKELQLTMDFHASPGARMSNVTWRIDPATILVSGPADVLNNMDAIVLDDFTLADLGSTTNYSYAIPVPEGCENLSGVTRATLTISFNDMLRTTVGTSNFRLVNEPADRHVTVQTEQLAVIIFGTTADVSAVTGEDIQVTVDLADFGSAVGTYTVPAEVTVPGRDVGVTGSYQVRVTISDTPEEEPQEPEGPDQEENPDTGDETT